MLSMPVLLNIVTDSQSTIFFRGNLSFMKKIGFNVGICSSPGKLLNEVSKSEGVDAFELPMEREISPLKDIIALWRLMMLMRRLRPTIVNAGTAKAGLLGMLAAFLTGVPIRIHQQRGLRSETLTGLKRQILLFTEWLACKCATKVICNSFSLRDITIKLRLASEEKCTVLGAGSSRGVDSERFSVRESNLRKTQSLQRKYGISPADPVIGFIGRLVRDKGISELREAYERIQLKYPSVRLVLIGPPETGDPIGRECLEWLEKQANVIFTGHIDNIVPYYSLFHVLAFPSYREGFPNVPLEAAAMQIPVVGFRSTGVVDAVQDGVTGMLVTQGDVDALTKALMCYLSDPVLRVKHGQAGRERVVRDFQPYRIWEALYQLYVELMKGHGFPIPESR